MGRFSGMIVSATALVAVLAPVPAHAQTTDTTAPTLAVATVDPAAFTGMRSPWYRGPVKVTFAATDDVAVTKLQYSMDNGATWIDVPISASPSVGGVVTFTQEGNTSVRYRALDGAGNVSVGATPAPANTTLNAASTAGATSIRLASTNGRAAGDKLTIDSGAGQETATIASIVTPNPAAPAPNVTLTAPLANAHASGAAVVAQAPTPSYRTVTVAIDTKAPVVAYPTLTDGPITASSTLTSTLTDPTPGSSGTGLNVPFYQQLWLDGKRVNAAPINLAGLSNGTHTVRSWVNDQAGNAAYYTQTFTLSTAADGARSVSVGSLTSEAAPMPTAPPAVVPTKMTPNPNAAFKILIVSRTQGFRHNHIPDTIVALQKLGAENGFNVDVFDPALPDATIATNPLTSAATLAPYKAVVFDSTTGNANFSIDEQTGIQDYIRGGGGYVGIHAATDCCRQWPWYQALTGGIFTSHPQGPNAADPGCETCFWATVKVDDPSTPMTRHLPLSFDARDELYNFDRNPRLTTHVLTTLDESSYQGNYNISNAGGTMPADHPISWCQNYDGGRAYTQALGHLRERWYDASFLQGVLHGIRWAAGVEQANCVSHREVRELVAAQKTAGTLTATAADRATALINSAYTSYAPPVKNYAAAVNDIDALRALAQQPESGDAAARGQLLAKANELRQWMLALGADNETGTVGGTVPATLALSLGSAPAFGAFTPAIARDYETVGTATVTSTAGDAVLSVLDPSSVSTGRLVNGAYSLPQALQVKATSAGALGSPYAALSGTPLTLLTYSGPISNDAVTLGFMQRIGANDALRTGAYSKTLTYTLSTTTP